MKYPNCKETHHAPGATFCHACGFALPPLVSSAKKIVHSSKQKTNRFGEVISIVLFIACAAAIVNGLSSCTNSFSMGGLHAYVDTESEYNWRFNRRLDPDKYDYLLTGAPEPPPVTGFLKVDSVPQGARVYLDGKKTGLITPTTIEGISEGKHIVSVRMKGTRVRNSWYHVGTGTYSILFNFYGDGIPFVSERP